MALSDRESAPLLPTTTNNNNNNSGSSRIDSFRHRTLSSASTIAAKPSSRWWIITLSAIVASLMMAVLGGLFSSSIGAGKPGNKDNDYTILPEPQPGMRNPNYLVQGQNGAVASEVDSCSQIGVEVLRDGGTATDAGIAATLCIGTTNMFSSGIGGGGFMIIKPSPNHASINPHCTHPISIDFRETAPAGASSHMFTLRPLDPTFDPEQASRVGGLAVAVPGELRGLEKAFELCGGGVSWERLVRPSVALARESKVGLELGRRLNLPVFSGWMLNNPLWSSIFAPTGKFLQVGDILRRENYARSLEIIAKGGVKEFYEGKIAHSLVKTVTATGGILTLEDLANYRVNVAPAFEATYRGRKYYTGAAPSAGPVIVSLLNTLDGFKKWGRNGRTGLEIHRFIEAMKFAFAARTELGDPDFPHNAQVLKEIVTREYAARVRANITDNQTHPSSYYNPNWSIQEDHGTTHISVIDRYGSAVAITSTVNLIFGSRVMDEETGIILNDEMDDFATPNISDAFGLRPSPYNYPAPGKRPLSSTAPLIMDHYKSNLTYLAIGGSGGSRIFGSVAQVILNLDWGMDVGNAVEQARVHDQLAGFVSIEAGYRPDLMDALTARGHNISMFDINLGIAEVQAVTSVGRTFFATSDSRKNGVPAAY